MNARRWVAAVAAAALVGCGGNPSAPTTPTGPLTVTEWEKLPVDQKYSESTLQRLKTGNPDLETAEGWEKFQKATLAPARKKDYPNGKPR